MAYNRIIRVYVSEADRNPLMTADGVRRQSDYLGPAGIRAKRGQTNVRFQKTGYLRFVFPSRQMRTRFLDRVRKYCGRGVSYTIHRRRR
jgi:hypothetical protein